MRSPVLLVLGALMLGFGAYIIGRLIATGGAALSGNPWLDGAFAAFFVLRGASNLVNARRQRRAGG